MRIHSTRTRPSGRSSRLARAGAAIAAVSLLAAGLAVVGVAAPASAHTGDLHATAVCNPQTGKYTVTYTLELTQVDKSLTGTTKWRIGDDDFDGTPKSAAGMDKGPLTSKGNTTLTLGTQTLPGTTKNGPWVYAYTEWSDRYGKGSDGRVENLKGDCGGGGGGESTKISFCHWTGNGRYQRIETDVAGLHNGHAGHPKDIYPAYSYKKNSKTYSGGPQGDQSLLQYEDCEKPVTKVPVPAKPSPDDQCGTALDRILPPTPVTGVAWEISAVKNGKATATAKTLEGYVFTNGETSKTWYFEFSTKLCKTPVPAEPAFSDACGPDNESFTEPVDTTEVDWTTVYGDGTITVTAAPQPGYVFDGHFSGQPWVFVINDKPCPPTIVTFGAPPTGSDTCGPDNGILEIPQLAEGSHYRFVVVGSEAEGRIVVTAVADEGYVFDEGQETEWSFDYVNTPCIELGAEPTRTDDCGVDLDAIVLPSPVDHVTWSIDGDVKSGSATAIASTDDGYTFTDGTREKRFPFQFTDVECIPASLQGSVATGVCEADVPWIYFHIELDDPDAQSTSREAFLVFTDGTETERIFLGEIDEATGVLDDRVLWPGASVDAAGKPTGWPGWTQNAAGEWIETTGNFAWTRDLTTATIEVNPDLAVDVSYPPATPDCVSGPRGGGGHGGARLASTGFNGTPFAIIGGIIVLAGIAFVAISVVRKRKRA